MKNSKSYNGYANRSQWNQSLWLNNDEGFYRLALECIKETNNRTEAVSMFLDCLGSSHTPDGYKWSKAGIRAGMVGL